MVTKYRTRLDSTAPRTKVRPLWDGDTVEAKTFAQLMITAPEQIPRIKKINHHESSATPLIKQDIAMQGIAPRENQTRDCRKKYPASPTDTSPRIRPDSSIVVNRT